VQGSLVYVDYDAGGGAGFNEYHERRVIAHMQGDEYMVASPTFDLFIEQLSAGNPDLADMRLGGPNGEVPVGLTVDFIFGFGVINRVQRDGLLREGEHMAALERVHRGFGVVAAWGIVVAAVAIPVPVPLRPAAPAGVALAGAGAGLALAGGVPPAVARGGVKRSAPPGGCWVLDEPTADFDIGDVFTLPAGAAELGGRALVVIGREVCVLKELLEGGDLLSRHQRWRSESGVKGSNPIVHEHHLLSMLLQYAGCFDRLNLKGLLCMEFAWRRVQRHESAVSENPEFPSYGTVRGGSALQGHSTTESRRARSAGVIEGGGGHEGEAKGVGEPCRQPQEGRRQRCRRVEP